jgi:hypothetical protein
MSLERELRRPLSPLPETRTCHSVLDLVKLEKRVPANHDSPHRWWPTNAPIISGAIGAKQYFCFDRLNTTRKRNSPTLPYIEYATNFPKVYNATFRSDLRATVEKIQEPFSYKLVIDC